MDNTERQRSSAPSLLHLNAKRTVVACPWLAEAIVLQVSQPRFTILLVLPSFAFCFQHHYRMPSLNQGITQNLQQRPRGQTQLMLG